MFKTQVIYVRLQPERIRMRYLPCGAEIDSPPLMAIDQRSGKPVILAVGDEAQKIGASIARVNVVNPFAHPRMLISDFTLADALLRHFFRQVLKDRSLWSLTPRIVMHPDFTPEGGFTQVELRAMREICLAMGATRNTGWQGRPLEDAELLAGKLPADGVKLW